MSQRLTAYALLLLTSVIWGISGPLLKYSFTYISPFEFLFWRFLLASIITLPLFAWYLRKHKLNSSDYGKLIVLGLIGTTLNLSLGFLGLAKTTVVEATVIGSLTPMLTAVASAQFLHETVTRKMRLGLGIAVLGSVVTVIQPLLKSKLSDGGNFEGNVLTILAGVTWVLFVLLAKRWQHGNIKPFHVVSTSFFIGLLSFFMLTVFAKGPGLSLSLSLIPKEVYLPLVYMAVFSSLIAYTAYETALSKINASQADLFNYLNPIWSVPLAIIWLKEEFSFISLISVILIALGIFIAEYKKALFTPPRSNLRGHHLAHHK